MKCRRCKRRNARKESIGIRGVYANTCAACRDEIIATHKAKMEARRDPLLAAARELGIDLSPGSLRAAAEESVHATPETGNVDANGANGHDDNLVELALAVSKAQIDMHKAIKAHTEALTALTEATMRQPVYVI